MTSLESYEKMKVENAGMAEMLGRLDYRNRARFPNKLPIKEFCEKNGIPTAKIIAEGDMEEGLPEALPNQYCLKPVDGNSTRGVYLMKDGVDMITGAEKSASQIREEYLWEMRKPIKFSRRFYIEELVLKGDERPTDISCFSVSKKARIYLVVKSKDRKTFYDSEWNYIDGLGEPIEVEKKKEVTELAEKVLEIFNPLFLRVDILEGDRVTLGELTKVSGNLFTVTPSFVKIKKGLLLDKYLGFLIGQEYKKRLESKDPEKAIYNRS